MASKKSRGGNHHVYGVHAVRSLLEKRPEAILDAKILRGSKAGSLPELARALGAHKIPIEHVQRTWPSQIEKRAKTESQRWK